ncbi:MAG: glycoside hydrolase family 32 protein [Planctomycetales bacterium]|nr:glycoside hydrolase family 32 protein [Planctomycetales bacterium]
MDRIRWKSFVLLFIGLVNTVFAEAPTAEPGSTAKVPLYQEALRPQFHFTARQWTVHKLNPVIRPKPPHGGEEGWLNDPNGLVYYKGEWHLFANGAGSYWVHAVSRDLVHWKELPPKLLRDPVLGNTASGSAVVDWNNTSGLGTSKERALLAFFTGWKNKVQCMAYSLDRGRSWTKHPMNPILRHADRDPKVFWYEPDSKWVMIVYGPPGRSYIFFGSRDLKQWDKLSTFPDMYECPDIFRLPLDGNRKQMKWVLSDGNGSYVIGQFDGTRFRTEQKKEALDYGFNFYATQTWSDVPKDDGRCIQMAWMRGGKFPDMPFNQQLTFPCVLSLRTVRDKMILCRYPVREIANLYRKEHSWKNVTASHGNTLLKNIKGDLFDIEVEFDPGQSDALGFKIHGKDVQYTTKTQAVVSCRTHPMKLVSPNGLVHLRILVDRTSIEVFCNRGAITGANCVLPLKNGPPPKLYINGGDAIIRSLKVREIKSIWPKNITR